MVGCLDIKNPHFPSQIIGVLRPRVALMEDLMPFLPSSGDLGDFASFVTHMKAIALVCVFSYLQTSVNRLSTSQSGA